MIAANISKSARGLRPRTQPSSAKRPPHAAGPGPSPSQTAAPAWNLDNVSFSAHAQSSPGVPLSVIPAGDPSERQADSLATRALRTPDSTSGGPLRTPSPAASHPAPFLDGQASESSVSQVLRSPGVPLDTSTRSFMEPRFGHDLSRIRIHTGSPAARASSALRAHAFTAGQHIVFGSDRFAPETPRGRRLLAHELAHLTQHPCDPPGRIRRKEVGSDAELRSAQDWTHADRQGNTQRWKDACFVNLDAVDSSQYERVVERKDFYRWFYDFARDKGFETRWSLAAYIVAGGAQQVADMDATGSGSFGNSTFSLASVELQGAMREGNQVIFDNVLPKLKRLKDGGPLKGRAALEWDMQTLADEQDLIQPMYKRLSAEALGQLEFIARKKGWVVPLGAKVTGGGKVGDAPGIQGGKIPAFNQPNFKDPGDRWKYGMQLGNQFTPGGTGFDPAREKTPAVTPVSRRHRTRQGRYSLPPS